MCGRNLITGLTSAASPRVDILSTCKVGQKLGVSLTLLTCSPFGVTLPATVPQRSEILDGPMNYPVLPTTSHLLRRRVFCCICQNYFIDEYFGTIIMLPWMGGELEAKILKYSQTDVAFSIIAPPLFSSLASLWTEILCYTRVILYFDFPPLCIYRHIFRWNRQWWYIGISL